MGGDAAIKTPGIVLIDEIDLHLHPKWQRVVVNHLREAFPKVQFIISTHSPFIIQSLQAGEVIDLNSEHVLSAQIEIADKTMSDEYHHPAEPSPAKGYSDHSIEDIVEEVMGLGMPSQQKLTY